MTVSRTTLLLLIAAVLAAAGLFLVLSNGGDTEGSPDTISAPSPTTTAAFAGETTTSSSAVAGNGEPVFLRDACEFDEPPGYIIDCGWLVVPEDRSNPGREVRLHVAIFRSPSGNPAPDPILYLEGGPGGDALETVPFAFERNFAPYLAERDFIMFDQRGTGYSEPSLACDEVTDLTYELLDDDLTNEEVLAAETEALTTCRSRLTAEGIDFDQYNSAVSAADVADLRLALGYQEWNLYGISYGTRLALTVLRDHPEGIRSVILDSTYPPDVDLPAESPSSAGRAFRILFDRCADDAECSAAFLDLEARFYALVDRLDGDPITVDLIDVFSLENYEALVDGTTLLGVVFQSLYSEELIPILPKLITDTEQGNTQALTLVLSNLLANVHFLSVGQSMAVQCSEEVPFSSPEAVTTAVGEYPELANLFEISSNTGPAVFEICAMWDVTAAAPIENQAVSSDTPTLVLAGEYDPITPPAWGERAAQMLASSYFVEFPGVGHGASVSGECPRSIVIEFLDNPTSKPSADCVARMTGIDFVTGLEPPQEVALVPVTLEFLGTTVQASAPEGWTESVPGTYARLQTALDQTALVLQAAPGEQADLLISLLGRQLGVEDTDPEGSYETPLGRWTLYEFTVEGNVTDVAVVEAQSATVLVILASEPAEHDGLYETVLLPVLDGLSLP